MHQYHKLKPNPERAAYTILLECKDETTTHSFTEDYRSEGSPDKESHYLIERILRSCLYLRSELIRYIDFIFFSQTLSWYAQDWTHLENASIP